MADIGTRYTDEQREELERRIHEIYQDAEKDITHKLNEHMRKFAIKDQMYQEKLQRGEITPAYYARWKSGQVFIGKMWKQKKADIHETAMNAGKASMDIINRKSIGVFAHNMNIQSYLLEKQFGATVGLNLYDVHTVSRMLRDNPKMLPEWKINEPKQYIWDEKRVQTAITQGIIQGESLDKIAKRIAVGLCGSDEKRMKLFAQTAMTGAQNAGRAESIREANEMGLETEKGWDATLDKRTRETHRILDGQFVAEDEDFVVNRMHIKYPGDPDAPPQLVYNCRCALVGRVKKYASGANYRRRDNTIKYDSEGKAYHDVIDYKTYKQWATEKGFWKERKSKQSREIPVISETVIPKAKRTLNESLADAYEYHRTKNNLTSVPYDPDAKLQFIKTNLANIGSDSKDTIEETLGELLRKYDTPLTTVETMDKKWALIRKDAFAYVSHEYSTDTAKMVINPLKCADKAKMVERLAVLRNKGYCASVPDEMLGKYVVTHEFGHSLLHMSINLPEKENYVNVDVKRLKSIGNEVLEIFEKYKSEVGSLVKAKKAAEMRVITTADPVAAEEARRLAQELKTVKISEYSLTDADEFFAESFVYTEYGGTGNKFADAVREIINENFKR